MSKSHFFPACSNSIEKLREVTALWSSHGSGSALQHGQLLVQLESMMLEPIKNLLKRK